MERLALAIGISGFVVIMVTVGLSKISKNIYIKYIPFGITLIFAAIASYNAIHLKDGFSDLANFLLALINIAASFIALITAVVIDIRKLRKNKKRNAKNVQHTETINKNFSEK